jgi:uncharacterized protein DUF1707
MRVSDAERQRVIDELRRHCGAGRLDVDEYAARIERALAATTLVELDDLLADLPMVRIADPVGAKSSRGAWRGLGTGRTSGPDEGDAYSNASGTYAAKGRALSRRMATTTVALLTVIVVLAVVVTALTAQWLAVALLLVGWLIGMVQGRMGTSRR